MSKLGITLKKLRESRNLTVKELAEKSGTGNGTIGNIERGANKATVKTLEKISTALNLNKSERDELFGGLIPEEMAIKLKSTKLKTIPVYSSVSAGLGRVPDAEPIDFISIPETTGDVVAVKVTGNSMEPTFSDGDIVVIKKDVEINVGEVGVFFLNEYDGEGVVKRLKYKNGVYVLESDNPSYEDKEIGSDVIISCGKVVNIIKTDLSKKRVDPLTEKLEKLDQNQRAMLESMLDGLIGRK